ncbi:MAG: type I-C CRISPR-associated endonuclease Cas1 [Clostridia bacterium]|nr:type I-C CRISPR-associated endonuclease Cas1c [Lachnospiraceae bacterium]NCC02186.1 type I-C CRISPR-associated endonuclease Cas1 [Clostridia bacterium]NCD04206.1 type I-C CRISPR-associated endonuclease Cas1 [Clostridia bacterium]
MKKLLNTLYVLSNENYLTLDGENVVVMHAKDALGRFPLHTLENIISFTYKGASPALMGACAERNVGLTFFSPFGKFLARSSGKSRGNVLLRKEQYRISDDIERSCLYARNMIVGKIYNCRWNLERTIRDHALRVDADKIKAISNELYKVLPELRACKELDHLRGIEGELAARYFSAFNELIINQKEDFIFKNRSKRPPMDLVNALLSFAYTILAGDCANALESVGLDAYVGFMHRDRPGRQSLALDLMEELRSVCADRFVLTLINLKIIRKEHFSIQKDGAVLLTDEGRKIFFKAWQSHKKEVITHPFLKEKVEWGLVPHVQAMLLARTIRGDLEEYPPFLWK